MCDTNSITKKLWITGVSFVLAVVMLVSASLAWFALSADPEIGGMQLSLYADKTILVSKDKEKKEFVQYINISEEFEGLVDLKPVSTVDGIHWFIPTYENNGQLKPAEEFILDDGSDGIYEYANVSSLDADGNLLTGSAMKEARDQGYYVYTDFWVMTEEENGCRLRLSVPYDIEGLDSWEYGNSSYEDREGQNGVYGTYVLENYEVMRNEDGQNTGVASIGRNAETSMRVGLLVDPEDKQDFYIYEPNADRRSSEGKPGSDDQDDQDSYVLDYTFNGTEYVDNNYIVTEPIGVTTLVTENPDGTLTSKKVGVVESLSPDKLIIQKAGEWDQDLLKETLMAGKRPGSNAVNKMGDFISAGTIYEGLGTDGRAYAVGEMSADIEGSSVILTLENNTPVKIRLFVWVEGQDVDCWNDIAVGSFVVNLELAGEIISPESNNANGGRNDE